jgi:hypothetical protein
MHTYVGVEAHAGAVTRLRWKPRPDSEANAWRQLVSVLLLQMKNVCAGSAGFVGSVGFAGFAGCA